MEIASRCRVCIEYRARSGSLMKMKRTEYEAINMKPITRIGAYGGSTSIDCQRPLCKSMGLAQRYSLNCEVGDQSYPHSRVEGLGYFFRQGGIERERILLRALIKLHQYMPLETLTKELNNM